MTTPARPTTRRDEEAGVRGASALGEGRERGLAARDILSERRRALARHGHDRDDLFIEISARRVEVACLPEKSPARRGTRFFRLRLPGSCEGPPKIRLDAESPQVIGMPGSESADDVESRGSFLGGAFEISPPKLEARDPQVRRS